MYKIFLSRLVWEGIFLFLEFAIIAIVFMASTNEGTLPPY